MRRPLSPVVLERLRALDGRSGLVVDPVQIARRLGIRVAQAGLPPSVLSALHVDEHGSATILLDERDSSGRRRFACARELLRFLRNTPASGTLAISRRVTFARAAEGSEDWALDLLAVELLVAVEAVSGFADGPDVLVAVACDVPREVLPLRLWSLAGRPRRQLERTLRAA